MSNLCIQQLVKLWGNVAYWCDVLVSSYLICSLYSIVYMLQSLSGKWLDINWKVTHLCFGSGKVIDGSFEKLVHSSLTISCHLVLQSGLLRWDRHKKQSLLYTCTTILSSLSWVQQSSKQKKAVEWCQDQAAGVQVQSRLLCVLLSHSGLKGCTLWSECKRGLRPVCQRQHNYNGGCELKAFF